MTSLSRAGIGFAFTVNTVDELTRFIVNVYGNDDVGVPLARNMNAIDDAYLDRFGIENLVIPISVSEAKEIKNDDGSYVVDVVVHSKVTSRCCNSKHPLHHKYVTDVIKLAVEWVQQECGVKLQFASCKLLGLPMYYSTSTSETNDSVERMSQNVMEYLTKMVKNTHISQTHQGLENNVCLPQELVLEPKSHVNSKIEPVNHTPPRTSNTNSSTVSNSATLESSPSTIAKDKQTNKNKSASSSDIIKNNSNCLSDTKPIHKTLVQEVIKPLQIKKGFLTETSKPLYGNEGSHEGEGKVYDELAHIPQSLRERCQVIDLRPDVQRSSSTVSPEANTSKHKITKDTNCKSETLSNITLTPKEVQSQRTEQEIISPEKENKSHTIFTSDRTTSNVGSSTINSVSSNVNKEEIVKINSTGNGSSVTDETTKSPIELMREKCEKVKSIKWVLHSIKEERGKCVMRLKSLKHVNNISDVSLLTNSLSFEVDDFHYNFSKPVDVSGVRARFDKHENVLKLIWPLNTY